MGIGDGPGALVKLGKLVREAACPQNLHRYAAALRLLLCRQEFETAMVVLRMLRIAASAAIARNREHAGLLSVAEHFNMLLREAEKATAVITHGARLDIAPLTEEASTIQIDSTPRSERSG